MFAQEPQTQTLKDRELAAHARYRVAEGVRDRFASLRETSRETALTRAVPNLRTTLR